VVYKKSSCDEWLRNSESQEITNTSEHKAISQPKEDKDKSPRSWMDELAEQDGVTVKKI